MILNSQPLDMYRTSIKEKRGHRQWTRARILTDVAHEHGLTVAQMLACGQQKRQTQARRKAICALHDAEYSERVIAQAMHRTMGCIRWVLSTEGRRKLQWPK